MKTRKAHPRKSAKVKSQRGFSPEEIVIGGELLGVRENPNYPDQQLEVYWFDEYLWVVPVDKTTGRLITAFKSRKFKKEYGR